VIIEAGHRRASIVSDVERATYQSEAERRHVKEGVGPSVDVASRTVVEVYRRTEPPQRALVGAHFAPTDSGRLLVFVRTSGGMSGHAATCPGAFGRELVPGLPDEFGAAVGAALLAGVSVAGVLVVDRAAYDEVESSSHIFGIAAALLAVALTCGSADATLEALAREQLATWQ